MKLSQLALADKMCYSRRQLQRYEAGKSLIPPIAQLIIKFLWEDYLNPKGDITHEPSHNEPIPNILPKEIQDLPD